MRTRSLSVFSVCPARLPNSLQRIMSTQMHYYFFLQRGQLRVIRLLPQVVLVGCCRIKIFCVRHGKSCSRSNASVGCAENPFARSSALSCSCTLHLIICTRVHAQSITRCVQRLPTTAPPHLFQRTMSTRMHFVFRRGQFRVISLLPQVVLVGCCPSSNVPVGCVEDPFARIFALSCSCTLHLAFFLVTWPQSSTCAPKRGMNHPVPSEGIG